MHHVTAHPHHVRDVGSGARFGADVYELYEAGQVAFPDLAAAYSHGATELHHVAHLLRGIASRLDHAGGRGVARRAEQLYDACATTSRRLHLIGEALVLMAGDFRRADVAAAEAFERLATEHRDLLSSATVWTPPPRPSDSPAPRPDDVPDDADLDGRLGRAGIPPFVPGSGGAVGGADGWGTRGGGGS